MKEPILLMENGTNLVLLKSPKHIVFRAFIYVEKPTK